MAEFTQDTTELLKMVADKREALRSMRFNAAGSRSRNVREGRDTRKEIARMLTEIRSRELVPIKKLQAEVRQVQKDLAKAKLVSQKKNA